MILAAVEAHRAVADVRPFEVELRQARQTSVPHLRTAAVAVERLVAAESWVMDDRRRHYVDQLVALREQLVRTANALARFEEVQRDDPDPRHRDLVTQEDWRTVGAAAIRICQMHNWKLPSSGELAALELIAGIIQPKIGDAATRHLKTWEERRRVLVAEVQAE